MEHRFANDSKMAELEVLFSRLTLEECENVIQHSQAILNEKDDPVFM